MAPKNNISIENTRIIGIFAHVDAGKTTTSEALLYFTGKIHRAGTVDDGNTQLDWMEEERQRGITITSSAVSCDWRGHNIKLIDTPGHIDFTAEVVRSIRVIDGAVILLCGVGGVEPQTETVWMHAEQRNLPRIIFVNKLDREGADIERVLQEIQTQLGSTAVLTHYPIGKEGGFNGVVDLLTREAHIWRTGEDEPRIEAVPAEISDKVENARVLLLDAICETDDSLLELHLEDIEPSVKVLKDALRRATVACKLFPVLCGATRRHIGVQPLLDAITDYVPNPTDAGAIQGCIPGKPEELTERTLDSTAPFCASIFKIVVDPHVGHLAWTRVFSGTLASGDKALNTRTGAEERVGRIYRMHANQREQVDSLSAGDVVALVGIKSANTGDTLCDINHPMELETFKFPEPVITVALRSATEGEADKLRNAVARLCSEDPTLISRVDQETGEETLAGMGELHLEVAVNRLRSQFGVSPVVSKPQVSFRETIRKPVEHAETYKKQTGGHGHFAKVVLQLEPLPSGSGVVFENEASGADVPAEFIRPTELGVRKTLEKGVLAGYPVTDIRVVLVDGRHHEVDSASIDFEIAASMAIKEAVLKAKPVLLEPVMRINVNIAEEFVGSVVSDIGRRRGMVNAINAKGNFRSLDGRVPLAETCGYATDLRSMSRGRGTFTLEFQAYEQAPESIAREVIKERMARKQETVGASA